MLNSPNRAPSGPVPPTVIKVIILSGERAHARMIMSALAQSQYAYVVCELRGRGTVTADLEIELSAVRGQMPVIVMIDFKFAPDRCEAILDHIAKLKGDMAIECLVTRPPADPACCDRLRDRGALLFSEGAEVLLSVLELQ